MIQIQSGSLAVTDWKRLALKAKKIRRLQIGFLIMFLSLVSLPIIIPYFWMLVISFSARTGGVESAVLWKALSILVPFVMVWILIHHNLKGSRRVFALTLTGIIAFTILWNLVGADVHLNNYRFLINANIVEDIRGPATAGGQFPWVWEAFVNSLFVATVSSFIKVLVSTFAGYYLSRFSFKGRPGFLQGLLVIDAFPAMILIIPIFILIYWLGLLDTLYGPILVISAFELPFFIFVMKGFFDGVPWDIEMSAISDGATRRQAFWYVVLPQVRAGIIAIGIFAFIKGWEEYVFVTSLRTGTSYWVMSTYLFYVAQDIMGVDYGMVAAVSVFYLIPSLILYLFFQKNLTQMTFGGVKG